MTDCGCQCHGHGAYPPPCDVPGGCGPHDTQRRCQRGHRCAARLQDEHTGDWLGAPADRPLCPICEQRVREALDDVPTLWTALAKAVRVKASGAHGERVSGHAPASQRSPLNMPAQNLLDEVHGLLTRWEEVVRDVARLTPPAELPTADLRVGAASLLLGRHLSAWLAVADTEFALDRSTVVVETGWQAAAHLLDWRYTARNLPGVDPEAARAVHHYRWLPCPRCSVRALTHRAGDSLIWCQSCGSSQPYEDDKRKLAVWIRETVDLPATPGPVPHAGPGAAVHGHDTRAGAAAHTITDEEGAA